MWHRIIVSDIIVDCCWRERVKPLQYFCSNMPMMCQIDQTKLFFYPKMYNSDNFILYTLLRLVFGRFAAVARKYRIKSIGGSVRDITINIYNSFVAVIEF